MARQPSVSLPPRSSLPPAVIVPKLRYLGRTWYARGADYWACRAGLAVVRLMQAAFAGLITAAILLWCWQVSPVLFAAAAFAEAAVSVAALWRAAAVAGRALGSSLLPRSAPRTVLLMTMAAFLTPGMFLGWLWIALLPWLPVEQRARAAVAAQLQALGLATPADPAPAAGSHGPGDSLRQGPDRRFQGPA